MSIQQHRGKSQLIDGECRIVKKTVEDMASWIKRILALESIPR